MPANEKLEYVHVPFTHGSGTSSSGNNENTRFVINGAPGTSVHVQPYELGMLGHGGFIRPVGGKNDPAPQIAPVGVLFVVCTKKSK